MKNFSKKIIALALVGISAVSVFAQRNTLKIATIAPARSAWDTSQKKLAQDWAKASGNSITMQFMQAGAMGGEGGVIQKLNAVRPGQKAPIDGAIFTSVGIAELAPDAHILTMNVPFLFRNQEEMDAVLAEFNPRLQKAVSDKGYVVLGWFNVGWAYFYTKKPAATIKELKSQRLSVNGTGTDFQALANAFKAAGFAVSDVPADKVLQSTRQPGGVESVYTIPMYAYASQYYKSLPYIMNVPICPVMAALVISEASWKAIPDQYKGKLMEAMKETERDFIANQKSSDAEYLKRCVEGGCTLVTPTAADLKEMEDTLAKDSVAMVKTGLLDQKFYDDIVAFLKKYRGE